MGRHNTMQRHIAIEGLERRQLLAATSGSNTQDVAWTDVNTWVASGILISGAPSNATATAATFSWKIDGTSMNTVGYRLTGPGGYTSRTYSGLSNNGSDLSSGYPESNSNAWSVAPTAGTLVNGLWSFNIMDRAGVGRIDSWSLTITFSGAAEIQVTGGGYEIVDGDSTPSREDNTDFGTAKQGGQSASALYTITNTGTSTLYLNSATVPSGFTIVQNIPSSLLPGSSTGLTVQLDTTKAGIFGGDVTFYNSDSDENPYNFAIAGTVLADLPVHGFSLSNTNIAENQPVGTLVGKFITTYPNPDSLTYTLVAGEGADDNASFQIAGNLLQTADVFDYETKDRYFIRVRATDQRGSQGEVPFIIHVIDLAETAPTITAITTDTGISDTDRITADRTLLISGLAEPGMDVQLYCDEAPLGSAHAGVDGAWTFDYTGTSLADGQYSFTATASGAPGNATPPSAPLIVIVDGTAPAAPTHTINNRQAQRSMVKRLDVIFAEPVALATDAATVKLANGQAIPNTKVNVGNPSGDQRTYVLTFTGAGAVGGSLADGIYDLVVTASGVQDLAGNTMTADYTQRFHRLFGDSDGNRVVNAMDYARLKQTFGRAPTDPLFNSAFDYEGNNLINALDLARFRQRYGLSYSY